MWLLSVINGVIVCFGKLMRPFVWLYFYVDTVWAHRDIFLEDDVWLDAFDDKRLLQKTVRMIHRVLWMIDRVVQMTRMYQRCVTKKHSDDKLCQTDVTEKHGDDKSYQTNVTKKHGDDKPC